MRFMERAFLIAVLSTPVREGEEPLAELRELLATAGAAYAGEMIQRREQPVAATYFGKGKLVELKEALKRTGAELVVVEDELSPTQQRNLEDRLGSVRVIDRTALILDIFAQHAHTAEGKLQVELAQLQFNLTRMRGKGTALSRLGGGIGTRGPGETRLEVDQRVAHRRIATLKRRLEEVASSREVMRRSRLAARLPLIALAGYTNTGKSTLLNALTRGGAPVNDRLFETLDPTTRAYDHEGKTYLLTDTVGFIRKLPHQLVEAFRSTLEETLVADLILHVADAAAPDEELRGMIDAVESVLAGIGAEKIPRLLVLNKRDRLEPGQEAYLRRVYPEALLISALAGDGLEELRQEVGRFFEERLAPVELLVPYTEGRVIGELYRLGAEIEMESREDGVHIRARLPRDEVSRFSRFYR